MIHTGLLATRKNSILHMLRYCIYVGFISGYAASFYTLFVEEAAHYSAQLFGLFERNKWYILLIMAVVFAVFMICTYVVRLSNVSRGSGVPQAMGLLRGAFIMKWVRGLIVMLTCSVLGTLVGLSLGSEGPAMIIGGLAAMGACKTLPMYTRNYMVTGGVSAGIAVAFNAPLSGVAITLEEGHKRFSPVLAFNSLVIVTVAMITSYAILGYRTILPVSTFEMSWIDVPFLMILGVIIAVLGVLFNSLLLFFRRVQKKLKFKHLDLRFAVPFILTIIVGILLFPATGGGAPLIKSLLGDSYALKMLFVLLIVKLLFTVISTSAGIPGGIFVPMLSVGAIIGSIFQHALIGSFDVHLEVFIVSAMVAYFTAVSHGYVTAILLSVELTHNVFFAIPALIVCTVTKIAVTLMKTHGLYDTLLDKTISENTDHIDQREHFKAFVQPGSFADGRLVTSLILPAGTKLAMCNGKTADNVRHDIALMPYDVLVFDIETLDNMYAKSVILSLLTSKNRFDELDGVPPHVIL